MTKAEIELSAVDKTKAAIDSAKKNLQGLGDEVRGLPAAFGAVGIAAAGAFAVNALRGVINHADELNKLTQKTGIATEALSQLQYVAKLNDVSNESLSKSIKKLNISIAEGMAGDENKIALFQSLGITTKDLGKGTQEVMLLMADAYAKAADGPGKVAVGNGLMGKSAEDMIPLLNAGRDGITALMREADKLGLTIGTDFAKNAEEFNDNLTRMQVGGQKLAIVLTEDLVRGLGQAMKAMADAAVEGGRLAGVIAGIQTLLTGDDRHKNNVQLVEQTNELLLAENALARSRAKDAQFGDKSRETAANEKRLAKIKGELAVTTAMRKDLQAEEDKSKAAAAALAAAREKAKPIKLPGAGKTGKSTGDKEREDLDKMVLKDAGFAPTFVEDWEKLNKLFASGRYNIEQLTSAQARLLADQPGIKARVELETKLGEIRVKTGEMSDRYLASMVAENEQLVKSNQSLLDEVEQIGLSAEALNLVRLARLDANIAEEEANLISARSIEKNEEVISQTERKINLLRKERDLKAEQGIKEIRAADIEDNKRRTEGISQSISEGLLDGFRNGRSLSDIFLSELKAQFAKTVLQPLISPIVGAGNDALSGVFKSALGGLSGLFGDSTFGGAIPAGVSGMASSFGGGGLMDSLAGMGVFDGGGYTGDGLRSGGLDGKGGFMAMLHPQETVVDHSKGQKLGGSTVVNNYTFGGGVSRSEVMAGMQQVLAQARTDRVEDGRRRRA